MKKLTQREITIAVVCAVMIAVFFVVQFMYRPAKARGLDMREQIEDYEEILQKNLTLLTKTQQVTADFEQLQTMIGVAQSDGVENSEIVTSIEQVAALYNISVLNLKPERVDVKKLTKEYSVQLTIDGEWQDIVHFIHDVQGKPHLLNLDEIIIERMSTTSLSLKARLNLSRTRLIKS